MNEKELERIRQRDEALVAAAKGVKVLTQLDWPASIEECFLAGWRAGRPELPTGMPGPREFPDEIEAPEAVKRTCDRSHPIENVLYKTAESYATAARMLAAVGTPEFTQPCGLVVRQPVSGHHLEHRLHHDREGVGVAQLLLDRDDLPLELAELERLVDAHDRRHVVHRADRRHHGATQ